MISDKEANKALKKIESLDTILNDLSNYYSELGSMTISRGDIFDSLYLMLKDKFEWEHPLDFWDLDITYNEAKNVLSEFNFKAVLFKIETERDIIPSELLIQYKVHIKSKGLIWIIHKYDADPFPSNPHAHEMGSDIKMDLKNGKCYRKKQLVSIIKKKDLIIIREKAEKNFNLPELEI